MGRNSITKQLLGFKKENEKKQLKFEELKASCEHKHVKKGKLKTALHPIDGSGEKFECEICGTIVELDDIPLDVLQDSIDTVLKAIEAIKAIGEFDDYDKVLAQLAQTKLMLERIVGVYKNLVVKPKKNETEYRGQANNQSDIFASNMYQGGVGFGGNPLFRNGKGNYKNNKKKHHKKHKKNNYYDSPFYG